MMSSVVLRHPSYGQVLKTASVGFLLAPFFQEMEKGQCTAWALVVERHLQKAIYNFPQAGFQ